MIDLNRSRNLAARPRAGRFPVLLLLAALLALVTPLRADNPPTYQAPLFQGLAALAPPGIEKQLIREGRAPRVPDFRPKSKSGTQLKNFSYEIKKPPPPAPNAPFISIPRPSPLVRAAEMF